MSKVQNLRIFIFFAMTQYPLKDGSVISRKHLVSVLEWCKRFFGPSMYFPIETLRIRFNSKMELFIGEFDIDKNCIYLNPKLLTSVQDLIMTIIHEYFHFQQDYDEYVDLDMKLPRKRDYFDHPHERLAEDNAIKHWKKCYSDLSKKMRW